MKKTVISYTPFLTEGCGTTYDALWAKRGIWKAKWIANTEEQHAHLSAYRNCFRIEMEQEVRIHVSGDAVYSLYLDGVELLRGPELGEPERYCFDTLDLRLTAGSHVFCALVWTFGECAPFAKISLKNGFILAAEGELSAVLDTNVQKWHGKILPGVTMRRCCTVGPEIEIDHKSFPSDVESGGGTGWNVPIELYNGRKAVPGIEYRTQHLMVPGALPEQYGEKIRNTEVVYVSGCADHFYDEKACISEEIELWQSKLDKGLFSVRPQTTRKILLRLDDYYCGFPVLKCSGGFGSVVSVRWCEALLQEPSKPHLKGDRSVFVNRYFHGQCDRLFCGGKDNEMLYFPWYRSGCFVELLIQTGAESLEIKKFELKESRYPMQMEASFHVSDERLNECVKPALRTLQMCMHDTYMDCPYYEQLMYLGDARIQMLLNYLVSADCRLAEKSIRLIANGRMDDGLLQCRYPAFVKLGIPPFSMLFAGIVNDYVKHVANPETLREILPRLREVMDSLEKYMRPNGLVMFPDSWNFVDWVREWETDNLSFRAGSSPESSDGISGVVNWTYAYALGQAAELHDLIGEHELAARYKRLGEQLSKKLTGLLYRPEKGLFSDLQDRDLFSEHSQCLALLSGFLPADIETNVSSALFSRNIKIAEATVYFSFYYFEACFKYTRFDKFMERMQLWFDMKKSNLHTMLESPEPSRSDCHAWSAHPLYHYFASLFGVRPDSAGCRTVKITPMIGNLESGQCSLPHPYGNIDISFQKSVGKIVWQITLPQEMTGRFEFEAKEYVLKSGMNSVTVLCRLKGK